MDKIPPFLKAVQGYYKTSVLIFQGGRVLRAKDYLKNIGLQLKRLNAEINLKRDQIEEYDTILTTAKIPALSEVKVQTSISGNTLETLVIKKDELQSRLKTLLTEKIDIILQIDNQLQQMKTPLYHQLIYWRYVKGLNYEDIAEKTGYSLRHIHRIHGWALVEFEQVNGALDTLFN